MPDIQALEQNRRAKKYARRQALRDQALEDLPKEGHGATRPPTAPSSSSHTSASTSTVSILATSAAPATTIDMTPAPMKAQPPTTQHRHLIDEPSDEDVEILGASEDLSAPWQHDNFVMPKNRKDYLLLAKKIGVMDTLEKIDVHAPEGPQVIVGWGILQQVAQMDKIDKLMSLGSGYLANRIGLLVNELATNAVAMDNLVAYNRELKEEAEGKLSQSMDDLNATSAELQRVSMELENVSIELKITSRNLQAISDELSVEKQASEVLNAHLAAVEDKAMGLELELVF